MSCGERSCKTISCFSAAYEGCNVDCIHYQWDGYTKPDSKSKIKNAKITLDPTPFGGYKPNRSQRKEMKKPH